MNTEQAIKIAKGLDSERPGVGEALCIIDEKLDAAKFNWITGQKAFDALQAAFDGLTCAEQVDAIHAAKGWEHKIKLYKRAFPAAGFRVFWIQFGISDADEKCVARSLFARNR